MRRLTICLCAIGFSFMLHNPVQAQPEGVLEFAFPNLSFHRPVALKASPDGGEWLFVVEQAGVVRAFPADHDAQVSFVVIDLTDRVLGYDVDVESGLIGLALHPQFADNGYIYLHYLTDITGAPTARISRFTTTGTPAVADVASELVLIEHERDDLKHNGGDLHFSSEGYLFASFGDGACCGDPAGHGQNKATLFSTIIRIDVDNPQGDLPYGIPADNPFVGNTEGWREEIWAYGLRNPWRFSIHPETGDVWVGDVGSLTYEEINRIVPGGNYGWSIMEGPDCFEWPPGSGQGTNCDTTGLLLPAWYYGRDVGVSVTGGYFYRGSRREDLQGKYVFADWGAATLFAGTLDEDGTALEDVEVLFNGDWPLPPAFGEDGDGELYVVAYFGGRLYRFVEGATTVPPEPEPPLQARLTLDGPNPFSRDTRLLIEMPENGVVTVELFDALGRRLTTLLTERVVAHGTISVPVSRSGLASGVYVARLVVDGRPVDIAKLMVLE